MRYTVQYVDEVVVVEVADNIAQSKEIAALQQSFKEVQAKGYQKFVVNLANLLWAESIGAGLFLGMLAAMKHSGTELVLTNVTDDPSVRTCFRLLENFTAYGDPQQAIAGLAGTA